MKAESNPILDFATDYVFPGFSEQTGADKIVAFGDQSHKCPIYVRQTPPCSAECPAGEDIRGINRYLNGTTPSDDPMRSAWETAVDRNPFPAVMGRICPHPCQSGCNRGFHDESVAINAVEHAIGNYAIEAGLPLPGPGPDTGKRVAVIGGGPAGLSAAYQLRRKGHAVTIYDANSKLGGMVLYGIMGYRVDRRVLETEIQRIIDLGVETKMGVRVGRDVTLEQLEAEYDAVFLGVGAQVGRDLPVPGFEGTAGVTNAIDFLRNYEVLGDDMPVGRRVVVIGDGNVAMDVARLALRLGSEAAVVSGVPREEMACFDNEFDDALREGTRMYFQTGTLEVLSGPDGVSGLRCSSMTRKRRARMAGIHRFRSFVIRAAASRSTSKPIWSLPRLDRPPICRALRMLSTVRHGSGSIAISVLQDGKSSLAAVMPSRLILSRLLSGMAERRLCRSMRFSMENRCLSIHTAR